MTMRTLRIFGALAVLAMGAVHLQQYIGAGYHSIPTIGTLFLLNAIGASIVGIGLLVPVEREFSARTGHAAVGALALAGVAMSAVALVSLFISESSSLFGFSESGYRTAIVFAIVVEAAAIVLLVPVAVVNLGRARSRDDLANDPQSSDRAARPHYGATA
jgi:hypothetical protein